MVFAQSDRGTDDWRESFIEQWRDASNGGRVAQAALGGLEPEPAPPRENRLQMLLAFNENYKKN
jgi:hypothetical protein